MNKLTKTPLQDTTAEQVSPDGRQQHRQTFDAATLLSFLKRVTRSLNTGTCVEESLTTALEQIATFVGWPVGHVYLVNDTLNKLQPTGLWYRANPALYDSFIDVTQITEFDRGQGMPGRVWETAVPQWMARVEPSPAFPRAQAAFETGLVSGFGFPLTSDGLVVGVVEFFSTSDHELDAEFLDCLDVIGSRLGRMVTYYASQDLLERNARILDHVDEIIAITDSNGVIRDCNSSFVKTFGVSKTEVIGKRTGDFAAPGEDIEDIRRAAFPILEATGAWQGEIAFRVADGTTHVFELNTVRHEDPVTKDIGLILSGRDVTARKAAEDAVRTNENRLARAIETHDAAVFDRDFESDSTFMSDGMRAISGYGEDLGHDRRKWLDLVLPEDKAISKDAFGALRRGEKDRFDIEYRIQNAKGEVRWIRSRGVAVKNQSGETTRAIGMLQDITESKTALDQLRLNNAALEATESAVMIVDAKSTLHPILFTNTAFENMMGYTHDELIGQPPADILNVSRDSEDFRKMLEAETLKKSVELTLPTPRKDGTEFIRHVTISPIMNDAGEVTHLVSVSKDVTTERQQQEQLRRQATVVQTMADAVMVTDERGVILDCNPAYADMMGYERTELIGRLGSDFHIESEERPDPTAEIRRSFKAGKTWQGEMDIRRKDGESIIVEAHVTSVPVNEDGSKTIIAVCRDVTSRRQMEASLDRQAAALNNIKEAMLIQNSDGIVIDCNEGAQDLYGYPVDELIGMSSRDLVSPNVDTDALYSSVIPEITSKGYWTGELEIKRKDGALRQIEISSTLLRDRTGAVRGWVELNRDITNRKALEKDLRLSRAALEATDVSVVITDAQIDDAPIIYANPAFEQMTGYSREESLGKSHKNFLDIDSKHQNAELGPNDGRPLEPIQFSAPTTRKDGTKIMRDVRVAPIYDDHGTLTNWLSLSHDATEELKVQENLRRQAVIMETMSDAVAIIDLTGIILDCNAAYVSLLGYDRSELVGRSTLHTWIDAQEEPDIVEEMAARTASGTGWSGENRIRHKDGSEIVVDTKVTPIIPDTGEVRSAIIVCRDVTERKQIDGMRRLHSMVMEQLDEAVVVLNLDGELIDCNAKAEKMMGYSRDELIGQMPLTMMANTNDSERQVFRQRLLEELNKKGIVQFENKLQRKDGAVRDVLVTYGNLVNEVNDTFARVVVAKDITDEKQAAQDLEVSRQRVEAVIEASHAAIWEMDTVQGRTFIGPVLKDLSGYGESFSDNIKEWRTLVHPDDLHIYDSRYKDWDGKRKQVDAEYRILNKDGEIKWVRSRGEMFGNEHGEMIRGIGLGWDITAEKERELHQEELEQRLMQSQKMETLGTLTGGIAHDFNNILTPILGYAHLARTDDQTGKDVQPHIDRIINGAERAKELVRRILTFSRQIEPKRTQVDIQSIAREVFSLISASAPPQIEINVKADGQDLKALADAVQVHQALMNLCTNGLQAMGEGPGTLMVDIQRVVFSEQSDQASNLGISNGTYICIGVQDTGDGIDPEITDRIFEPFFTTRDVDEGTGLGLSVVHGIVEAHNGAIMLDTSVTEGTRFNVYLPALTESGLH